MNQANTKIIIEMSGKFDIIVKEDCEEISKSIINQLIDNLTTRLAEVSSINEEISKEGFFNKTTQEITIIM